MIEFEYDSEVIMASDNGTLFCIEVEYEQYVDFYNFIKTNIGNIGEHKFTFEHYDGYGIGGTKTPENSRKIEVVLDITEEDVPNLIFKLDFGFVSFSLQDYVDEHFLDYEDINGA